VKGEKREGKRRSRRKERQRVKKREKVREKNIDMWRLMARMDKSERESKT
jgi:hypothetical protein